MQQAPGEPLDKERSRICRKACDYIRHNPRRQAANTNLTPTPRPASYGEPLLTSPRPAASPAIVLDTNVVLDWLLFRDPSSAPLAAAITQQHVRWVATASMRSELADVLRRGLAATRNADPAAALAAWDLYVESSDEPPRLPGALMLSCTDTDDQVFLELAYATGARWLLSRDRALLRLARRAAAVGFAITAPDRWSPRAP
jgi:uncharacterized protein